MDTEIRNHAPIQLLISESVGVTSDTQQRELGVFPFMRLLAQHRRLIFCCTIATVCAATLYCMVTTPHYQATATLEIESAGPVVPLTSLDVLEQSERRKIEHYRTIIAKLHLASLADMVLNNKEIGDYVNLADNTRSDHTVQKSKKVGWEVAQSYALPNTVETNFKHPTAQIAKYLGLIQILPIHETNLVNIMATASSPLVAQRIANTHAKMFIQQLKGEESNRLDANLELLRAQTMALTDRIKQTEEALGEFAKKNKLTILKKEGSSGLPHQQIQSLAVRLADATAQRIKSETAYQRATQYSLRESSFLDNEIIFRLRSDLSQAEAEYASMGSQVTDAYPGMRELRAKISSLREGIKGERNHNLQTLRTRLDADLANETSLKEKIEEEKSKIHQSSRKVLEYEMLQEESQSMKKLHATLQNEIKSTETAKAIISPHVSIVDYAQTPVTPISPKTNIVISLASILGFAGGVMLTYLLHLVRNGITSIAEAKTEFNLPILGSLPHFQKKHAPALPSTSPKPPETLTTLLPSLTSNSAGLPSLIAPHSHLAEALRTIRANVLLSSMDYPPRIILISSALQGEGKTTVLSNLAVTLGQANHRTLVIDGDLRIGGLSALLHPFYHHDRVGLAELLIDQLPASQAIYQTDIPNLDIIPAGTKPYNPAELLGSSFLNSILKEQRDQYDFILIDSPPILPVADALLLSRLVDGVLFIVRCDHTSRSLIHRAKEQLQSVKARILGLILNEIPTPQSGYSTDQYGANYIMHSGYEASDVA